jgi:hypothetical protein
LALRISSYPQLKLATLNQTAIEYKITPKPEKLIAVVLLRGEQLVVVLGCRGAGDGKKVLVLAQFPQFDPDS